MPEMVRLWAASAVTLGLAEGRIARCGQTRCLNLMLTYAEGCPAHCAYCGEAGRDVETLGLSPHAPASWPLASFLHIVDLVEAEGAATHFQRVCIATTGHPRGPADTAQLVKVLRRRLPAMPVSVLFNPADDRAAAQIATLAGLGIDSLSIGLDVATPDLFETLRGDGRNGGLSWQRCWDALGCAISLFGRNRCGVHLVAGLGESERQLLEVVAQVKAMGGASRLFAFRPEPGSDLVRRPAIPRDQWRRLQLARYLIDCDDVPLERMSFDDDGRVVGFGILPIKLNALITAGTAFRTSGCRGGVDGDISACNRPWMDSPPDDIASFPTAPSPKDQRRIRRQLGAER
ncbi:MAG TPA: radical SAM protein [Patescibacteria group bacterium]|nr:radical SAM protein [Patescibacteria group bacterium]